MTEFFYTAKNQTLAVHQEENGKIITINLCNEYSATIKKNEFGGHLGGSVG